MSPLKTLAAINEEPMHHTHPQTVRDLAFALPWGMEGLPFSQAQKERLLRILLLELLTWPTADVSRFWARALRSHALGAPHAR